MPSPSLPKKWPKLLLSRISVFSSEQLGMVYPFGGSGAYLFFLGGWGGWPRRPKYSHASARPFDCSQSLPRTHVLGYGWDALRAGQSDCTNEDPHSRPKAGKLLRLRSGFRLRARTPAKRLNLNGAPGRVAVISQSPSEHFYSHPFAPQKDGHPDLPFRFYPSPTAAGNLPERKCLLSDRKSHIIADRWDKAIPAS